MVYVRRIAVSGKPAIRADNSDIRTEADEVKSAIIREGLRLSHGTPGRLPRIVPSSGVVLCGHQIPAGVRIVPQNVS